MRIALTATLAGLQQAGEIALAGLVRQFYDDRDFRPAWLDSTGRQAAAGLSARTPAATTRSGARA